MSDTDFVLECLFAWMRCDAGRAWNVPDEGSGVEDSVRALYERLARDAATGRAMQTLHDEAAAGMAAPSPAAVWQFGHALVRAAQENRAFPHTLELLIARCRKAQAATRKPRVHAADPVPDGPEVFATYLRFPGPDNSAIASARADFISYLNEPENLRAATGILQGMMSDYEKYLGADDACTQSAREHLAGFMALTGQPEASSAVFEAMANLCGRTCGDDLSPRIQESIRAGVSHFLTRQDTAAGIEAVEDLLDACLHVFGAEHILTLTGRDLMDCLRRGTDDPITASEALQAPLADCLRTLGSEHVVTLSARKRLTTPLAAAASPAAAAGALKALLADCLFSLPPEHALTRDVERMLGYWLVRVANPL